MGFDAWVKKCFPVLVLALVAVAASFQASGIASLVGTAIGPRAAIAAPPPSAPLRAAETEKRPSAQAILERNPFDSTWAPDANVVPDLGEKPAAPGVDWYADPPCDKARVVLIASSNDPDWSFAGVAGPDGATMLRRRGDDLGASKVAFIGDKRDADERRDGVHDRRSWERVWLTAPNGTRCQLALGAKAPAPPAAAKPPAPEGPLANKIKKTGEHSFDVDRSAIEALMANPAELMKVRIVPEKSGDRVVGLKLQGIKPGSPLGAIGIDNGDTLTSINGYEMTDPQKMLEAYAKLTTADRLTASVLRGGKPVTIDLSIK